MAGICLHITLSPEHATADCESYQQKLHVELHIRYPHTIALHWKHGSVGYIDRSLHAHGMEAALHYE